MPDISKCTNNNCPIKDKCYRFTSVPSKFLQSYADWEFKIINDNHISCDGFWGVNKCKYVKRIGESCTLNNNCKYPNCE